MCIAFRAYVTRESQISLQVEAPDFQSGERRLWASRNNLGWGQALAMVVANRIL
jgi:hypothetical protein